MPTMSSSLTLANSTSSSDLSSPPNTRCRSCLAGRLGVSAARMIDLSVAPSAAATLQATLCRTAGSNVSFTLSFKRFGSLLWQGEAKVAQDGRSGVNRKKPAYECGGTGASCSRPHFSAGGPPAAAIPCTGPSLDLSLDLSLGSSLGLSLGLSLGPSLASLGKVPA